MKTIRYKLFFVMIVLMLSVSFTPGSYAQKTTEDINPVIMQGVTAAKTGITYWNAEAEICIKFDLQPANSLNQVKKWTAELAYQLQRAKDLVESNANYNTISNYLKFAYKTLAALKEINQQLNNPALNAIIKALETAIKAAEKIISLFN